jgi:hypothetical protein
MTLLVGLVADVVISWKLSAPEVPAEPVLASAIPAPLMAAAAAAAAIVAVMVLRMTGSPSVLLSGVAAAGAAVRPAVVMQPTVREGARAHIGSDTYPGLRELTT